MIGNVINVIIYILHCILTFIRDEKQDSFFKIKDNLKTDEI